MWQARGLARDMKDPATMRHDGVFLAGRNEEVRPNDVTTRDLRLGSGGRIVMSQDHLTDECIRQLLRPPEF